MKVLVNRLIGSALYLSLAWTLFNSCEATQQAIRVMNDNTPLTEQQVIEGLKEALRVSTDTAVRIVSAVDGFYRDEFIRILLPPEASIIMENKNNVMLKAVGITKLIDDALLTMNRAAENAAKSATPVFTDAIRSMTIQDAFHILQGSDTAATQYFRKKTYIQLTARFQPVISNSLEKPLTGNISANKAWISLTTAYNDITSITGWKKVNTRLDEYVTRKTLNGLFIKLGQEEIQIRRDPKSRVNDILKRVFGKQQ